MYRSSSLSSSISQHLFLVLLAGGLSSGKGAAGPVVEEGAVLVSVNQE
jgi:hypothetical protein